jgi:probable HAF family extracellular repeat protein
MKSLLLNSICVASLPAVLAMPVLLVAQPATPEEKPSPTRYTIQDLGVVGTNVNQPGQPFVISNSGWVSGGADVGAALHAVLWRSGAMIDIGNPGLGGNSMAFGVNKRGHAVGEAEDTATGLSTTEDFCGFQAMGYSSSPTPCVPFSWKEGKMVPLKTLGGVNGVANQINRFGGIAGYAENTTVDHGCSAPQTYQFKPVVWFRDRIQELPTRNDNEGVALSINDWGDVVGASGSCAPFNLIWLFNLSPAHALLWQNGVAIDLGSLGGASNNIAHDINSLGQVVGGSDLSGDQTTHAFLWTPQTRKMKDLGVVGEDFWSLALGINDEGQIVGTSANADFSVLRAFLRQNGALVDLNTLVAGTTALFLETACSINSRGEIIGFAFDPNTGYIHAYLAIPTPSD